MCHGQGKDSSDKLAQELSRMHEYCKVTSTSDGYKLLVRRFDGFQVMLSERRGSCEILFALKNKNGDGKFQAKFRKPDGLRLRHQTIGAQHVPCPVGYRKTESRMPGFAAEMCCGPDISCANSTGHIVC